MRPSDTPHRLLSPIVLYSYEDAAALDGGEEGMDVITHILSLAPWLLKDSGYGWGKPPIVCQTHPWHSLFPAPPGKPKSAGPRPAQLSCTISLPHRSIFLEVDPRHPELVNSWLQNRPGLSLSLMAVRKDYCGR